MTPVDEFFIDLHAHQRPLAEFIAGRFKSWYPSIKTNIKYNTLFFSGRKNICYFNIHQTGIDVGFIQGFALQPRPEFITANRKQVVSLFFGYEEDVDEELLKSVLSEAVKLDQADSAYGKQ